jgi:hypothetical protein
LILARFHFRRRAKRYGLTPPNETPYSSLHGELFEYTEDRCAP